MSTAEKPAAPAPPTQPRTPPAALFKFLNHGMRWLLRSPLHGLVSKRLILISFIGRKTGQRITTPVGYHWDEGTLLVYTRRPWWKNMEGGAPVTVWLQGKAKQGIAEPTREPEQIVRSLQRYAEHHSAKETGMRIGGATFEGDKPTQAELFDAAQTLTLIRIHSLVP